MHQREQEGVGEALRDNQRPTPHRPRIRPPYHPRIRPRPRPHQHRREGVGAGGKTSGGSGTARRGTLAVLRGTPPDSGPALHAHLVSGAGAHGSQLAVRRRRRTRLGIALNVRRIALNVHGIALNISRVGNLPQPPRRAPLLEARRGASPSSSPPSGLALVPPSPPRLGSALGSARLHAIHAVHGCPRDCGLRERPRHQARVRYPLRTENGYILTTDQLDAGSVGIFLRWTNQTQEAWVYSHDGPIGRRKRGYVLTMDQSDVESAGIFLPADGTRRPPPPSPALTPTCRCRGCRGGIEGWGCQTGTIRRAARAAPRRRWPDHPALRFAAARRLGSATPRPPARTRSSPAYGKHGYTLTADQSYAGST
eukprot:137157-Prorocentrum_minimum.AAC.1